MHPVTPHAWKLVLALALFAVLILSARARAPRRATGRADMRCLVGAALALYGAGTAAWLSAHAALAALVYAVGIAVAALAAWLSRAAAGGAPPRGGEEPDDHTPPEDPSGRGVDWDDFERAFRDYAARPRTPAGVSG